MKPKTATGDVRFTPLTFSAPGVYTFTIRESGEPAGWSEDPRVFRAVVTVTLMPDGSLSAAIEYPDGYPAFVDRRCGGKPKY